MTKDKHCLDLRQAAPQTLKVQLKDIERQNVWVCVLHGKFGFVPGSNMILVLFNSRYKKVSFSIELPLAWVSQSAGL